MTLFGVLAHVAPLSDPRKSSDTQNEFAQTWRRITHRTTSAAQFHPFCSRFRTSCGKRVCLVYLSALWQFVSTCNCSNATDMTNGSRENSNKLICFWII
jgi:hypothetical protein